MGDKGIRLRRAHQHPMSAVKLRIRGNGMLQVKRLSAYWKSSSNSLFLKHNLERSFMETAISILANLASIVTALVAVSAWGWYLCKRRERQRALEKYLLQTKGEEDYGRRTTLHLMAHLGMTEAQIMEAAFASKCIRTVPGSDERGRADAIFFEYTTGDAEEDMRLAGLLNRKGAGQSRRRRGC